MRASLNETKQIDEYIFGKLSGESALLMDARQLINPKLRMKIFWQRKVHELLRYYHQRKVSQELNNLHEAIFHVPDNMDYKRSIFNLFKS